jgi:hypothetical protein
MRYTGNVKRYWPFAVLAAAMACGGGDGLPTGPSPVTAEVEFRYVLTGSRASSADLPCVGQVRIQPSFWGFAQVSLMPVDAGTWTARFEEVPVGRHTVRLTALEGCAGGDLFANGARLPNGSASFALSTDGSVTP